MLLYYQIISEDFLNIKESEYKIRIQTLFLSLKYCVDFYFTSIIFLTSLKPSVLIE